jgi:hypothetical protein
MGRLFRAAVLLTFLASCGGGNFSEYFSAMQATERRWGVPVHVLMATIYQESKFVGNARTPHRFALGIIPLGRQSSAYGYSQALDGTWEEYQRAEGGRGARRDRIDDATDFMGWYMAESERRLGISLYDANNQYLAYHEGRTGYANQSYLDKAWLIEVAAAVQSRSDKYRDELLACGL